MLNAFIWRTVNNAMFPSLIKICEPTYVVTFRDDFTEAVTMLSPSPQCVMFACFRIIQEIMRTEQSNVYIFC